MPTVELEQKLDYCQSTVSRHSFGYSITPHLCAVERRTIQTMWNKLSPDEKLWLTAESRGMKDITGRGHANFVAWREYKVHVRKRDLQKAGELRGQCRT